MARNKKSLNKFTACMLTCNSGWIIKKSLAAIINQTRIFDQIIIVDDKSTDNTVEICERMLKFSGIPHKIFIKNKRDIAISRNIAWKNADSNYVCFVDSDLIIDPDWLKNMSKAINERGEDATVVQNMLNVTDEKTLKYSFFPFYALEGENLTKDYYIKVSSFASTIIKKSILKKVGGFNSYSNTGEDADLLFRIHRKFPNFKFFCVSKTSSWHYPPPGVINSFKKNYKWGKGAGKVAIRYRTPFAVKKAAILLFPPLTFPAFFLFCFLGTYYQKGHEVYKMNFLNVILASVFFVLNSTFFGLGALTNLKYLFKKFPKIQSDFPGSYYLHVQKT